MLGSLSTWRKRVTCPVGEADGGLAYSGCPESAVLIKLNSAPRWKLGRPRVLPKPVTTLKNSGFAITISDNLTYHIDVAQDFVNCYWCVALGMSRMQLGKND